MAPGVIDAAIAVASLALFGIGYRLARLATRPTRVAAAPPTPELGDEPPAVVSLLASHWRLTENTAESTLLDLAARRLVELRQPADNPYQTTVHLTGAAPPGDIAPYERRVLARIRGLAVLGALASGSGRRGAGVPPAAAAGGPAGGAAGRPAGRRSADAARRLPAGAGGDRPRDHPYPHRRGAVAGGLASAGAGRAAALPGGGRRHRDRTTAWLLPSIWADRCRDGDVVTVRVRPWSRRVVALAVAERAPVT